MNLTYKSNRLEKSLTDDKITLKVYGERAKKVIQRYREVKSSLTLGDLGKIPSTDLHPLQGNRGSQWSIAIINNWKMCVEIEDDPLPMLEAGGIDLYQITSI